MGKICVMLPAAPGWGGQEAFALVFDFMPRLMIASLIAYWCGEFANSFVLAKLKILTRGRYLWTRTISSTVVGQLVDSILVMFLAFGGSLPVSTIFNLILSGYITKVLYEAVMTPVTYLVEIGRAHV